MGLITVAPRKKMFIIDVAILLSKGVLWTLLQGH
jgi:hypothetical protein